MIDLSTPTSVSQIFPPQLEVAGMLLTGNAHKVNRAGKKQASMPRSTLAFSQCSVSVAFAWVLF